MSGAPLITVLLAMAPAPSPTPAVYDIVITGGRVVDGTGAPWFRADVGIRGDRIAKVGDLSAARAGRRIDAQGQVVAPGFIDSWSSWPPITPTSRWRGSP